MRTLALTLVLLAVPVLAEDAAAPTEPEKKTEEKADEKADEKPSEEKPFGGNRVILRGGANLDLNKTINLGGSSGDGRVTAGIHGGIGYLLLPRLTIDLDVSLRAELTPPKITTLEVTPGARYYLNRLQIRAGVPIAYRSYKAPPVGVGVLAGLAWSQPLAPRVNFVTGVDYTYFFDPSFRDENATYGRIELHAGAQTSF